MSNRRRQVGLDRDGDRETFDIWATADDGVSSRQRINKKSHPKKGIAVTG